MIDIDFNGVQFIVRLDRNAAYYERTRIVVRSLLSAVEFDNDQFYLSYSDLGFLRYKLDMLGLVDNRTISSVALGHVDALNAVDVRNEQIKQGLLNDEIQKSLAGRLKSTVYEDQSAAIAYIVNNKHAGIFDVMGFGKTVESLAATVLLGLSRTLVVCPLSVIIGFTSEVAKHTNLKSLALPSGRKEALQFLKDNMHGDWHIMFVHPENLINTGKKGYSSDITGLLRALFWDQIVVDEFHMYKNWRAKRTKCVADLALNSRTPTGESPRLVLMTGTPVSENPTSAYIALKLLSGERMPHVSRFEDYFCIKKKIKYGNKGTHAKITGYKNLSELKTLIERVSIRRTKDDVQGFPSQTFMVRPVILKGAQQNLYRLLCGKLVAGLADADLVDVYKFLEENKGVLRLRQLMNSPQLIGETGESAKYQELDCILEELLADPVQKVVVWTEWRAAVDLLYTRYNKVYGAAKVYGGVDNQALASLKQKFEYESKPRVIIAIPAKGGTGVDFLARARTAVYVERPLSYILYNQSLDRICRRIPPTEKLSPLDKIRSAPATIIFLDVVNSVDEMLRERLYKKVGFVDAVTVKDETLIKLGRRELLKYLK